MLSPVGQKSEALNINAVPICPNATTRIYV
jgi:hypothetical protein